MKQQEDSVSLTASSVEERIGCGRSQAWHFLLFQWITVLQACNIAFMVLGKYAPRIDDQYCRSPSCEPRFVLERGLIKDPFGMFDMVMEREPNREMLSSDCDWNETTSVVAQFHSIAIEWRLFCGKEKISYAILTTQMLGILLGSLVFGQLSDLYGRRRVLFVALLSQIACGAASSFSNGWQMFIVFRALIGFFGGGTHTTNQVLFAEVLNAKHRLWLSNIGGWPLGVGVFVVTARLTGDWRSLSLITNLACLPALFLLWNLDESPRWRLQHGDRYAKIGSSLAKLGHDLKLERPSRDLKTLTRSVSETRRDRSSSSENSTSSDEANPTTNGGRSIRAMESGPYTYLHLLRSAHMRRYALVVAVTHFASSCIAHGIMFNADALSGDIYVNLLMLASFRWLMNICTIVADALLRCGRKQIFIVPCLAVAVLSAVIVAIGGDLANNKLVTGLALSAGALSSPLWISTLLWPAELFPTPVRNLAASFGAMFDRLGGVLIPQILLLAKLWPAAPYAVFAVLALVSSISVGLVLPETKGRPLPERMPSVHDLEPAREADGLVSNNERIDLNKGRASPV